MARTTRSVPCDLCSSSCPKVLGAPIQFTYGKEDFHGPTVRERAEKWRADWKREGINAEPVGTRWV